MISPLNFAQAHGEVTEWPIVQHWKCCVPQGTAGSNPALSAINILLRKILPKHPEQILSN